MGTTTSGIGWKKLPGSLTGGDHGMASKEDMFEDFELAKLVRTLVIYGAAGALVGLAGEPLTEGNIVTATGATVFSARWPNALSSGLSARSSGGKT